MILTILIHYTKNSTNAYSQVSHLDIHTYHLYFHYIKKAEFPQLIRLVIVLIPQFFDYILQYDDTYP